MERRVLNMLKICFGGLPNEIKKPSMYFDNVYEDEWFEDPFVRAMVSDVDKSEVVSANLINSPVLGPISCTILSGGVKNLILAYKTDNIIDASHSGDNCAKWILEIAKQKDLTITLYHIMQFKCDFTAYILNKKRMIHTYDEYVDIGLAYI